MKLYFPFKNILIIGILLFGLLTPMKAAALSTLTESYHSAGAYDGWVLESTERSNRGGTLNRTATSFRLGDDAANRQYRAVLSFDTSGFPDTAIIARVTLKIKRAGLTGTNPFKTHGKLIVEIRKPYFGTSAGLAVSDFQATPNGSSAVASFNSTPSSNWYSATFKSPGMDYINKAGITQFRLRFTKDDNNDWGADFAKFYSGNYAIELLRPTLIIEYYDGSSSTELLQPDNLTYLGAFHLPDGPPEIGWEWSGEALTYYPGGDPGGPADGYPGSLFGVGHNWNTYVSEINIPVPVNSRNLDDLTTAETLQDFADIRGGLFGYLEIPRVGLEYLPPQGIQTTGKLYFSWAQHMGEAETNPSHGWSELTLSNPQTAGAWRIGDYWNYVTGDYLFTIPAEWADAHVSGQYLATGRFRDGGQGALGPSIFAIAPWASGNPPAANDTLSATPLLLYGNVYNSGAPSMTGYSHADEWSGAAWLTTENKAAVIFVGTKGQGLTWYGCADGTVWPDEPPYPPACPERGWWSDSFSGQILFYDPADLAAVANGDMETWQPQPYAIKQIDSMLFNVAGRRQKSHVGAISFDRQHGLLYIMEPLADGDKSVIHVWSVSE